MALEQAHQKAAVPAQRRTSALDVLLPPCPALDLATVATGLADAAARESVARLLARPPAQA